MAFKAIQQSSTEDWVEVEERLWVSDDDKLVSEGDPKAASLFAIPGQRISVEDAEKYGLVKARAKSEDKQRQAPANKAAPRQSSAKK